VCQFEEAFLQVPQECLILTMKANQKYFPLLDASGQLSHRFLIVSNIHPQDPSAVISGNERVVRPRLADAKFFYDQDRKKTLESRVSGLNKVVYHNQLGTQGERMQRVCKIAQTVSQALVQADNRLASIQGQSLVDATVRTARLAKTDLLTDMVGEFPELQGIMGRYYALHDGENALVAQAIAEHYQPRFAGDQLPENEIGLVAAMADKMETLIGMFGIGNLPSGDKDPFALRRHALGVTRILVERQLKISLGTLIDLACAAFVPQQIAAFDKSKLEAFFHERLVHYLEGEGRTHQHVLAVLSAQSLTDWRLLKQSLNAVEHFSQLPQSQALAAANKRITNILKKTTHDVLPQVNVSLLHEAPERHLYEQLQAVSVQADAAFEAGDYTGSLQLLAGLREPVDTFFNDVMVNAQDEAIRNNRLGLLKLLHTRMNRIADLSKLAN
jgi:glycyl-tRNA synthetase beta chain